MPDRICMELAAERRAKKPLELAERNEKIRKMIEYGSSYSDIAGMYGLKRGSIRTIVHRKLGGRGTKAYLGATNGWDRNCWLDGIT